MKYKRAFLIEGVVKNYEWGKPASQSLVAKLCGNIGNSGPSRPFAELWFGTHPDGIATISVDTQRLPLSDFIKQDSESILGKRIISTFGSKGLPYLLKVLSVGSALSIQTHPSKDQAIKLHASNPQLYKDASHKPEVAIPITEMKLLYGFRPYEEVVSIFDTVSELQELVSADTLAHFKRAKDESSRTDGLRQLFGQLVSHVLTTSGRTKLLAQTSALATRLLAQRSRSEVEDLVLSLHSKFPGDVGLFALQLMNLETVAPGEALFTEPGVPHAYLSGDLVEVMATSDNVIRAGLTTKPCDVNSLIEVADYHMGRANLIKPQKNSPVSSEFPLPTSDFKVFQLQSFTGVESIEVGESAQIIFSLNGAGSLRLDNIVTKFSEGQAYFIPAVAGRFEISVNTGMVFRVAF